MRTDGQAGMTKLIVVLRNFSSVSKNILQREMNAECGGTDA